MSNMQIIGYFMVIVGVFNLFYVCIQLVSQKKDEVRMEEKKGRGWTDPSSRSLKIKRKGAPKL